MLKLLTIGTLGSALVCGMAAAASAQTMPPPNPPNIRYILPGAADSYAAESSVLALSMADRTNGAIRAASPRTREPATELIPAWSATPAFADHALGLEILARNRAQGRARPRCGSAERDRTGDRGRGLRRHPPGSFGHGAGFGQHHRLATNFQLQIIEQHGVDSAMYSPYAMNICSRKIELSS
jgi:hypothetical protein